MSIDRGESSAARVAALARELGFDRPPTLDELVPAVAGALKVHTPAEGRQAWSMALRAIANTMEHTEGAEFDPVYAGLLTLRELVLARVR